MVAICKMCWYTITSEHSAKYCLGQGKTLTDGHGFELTMDRMGLYYDGTIDILSTFASATYTYLVLQLKSINVRLLQFMQLSGYRWSYYNKYTSTCCVRSGLGCIVVTLILPIDPQFPIAFFVGCLY